MKNIRLYIGIIGVMGLVACGILAVAGLALHAEGIGPLAVARDTAPPEHVADAPPPTESRRFVVGATATATPVPTATSTATPTPTPLPSATPTVTPEQATPTATPRPPLPKTPPTTVAPTAPPDNSPWATRLVIPALGLDAPVLPALIENDTWNVEHLDQAVGHLERTASPGAQSNIVLAGHVTLAPDGRSGPFIRLASLSEGDEVIVYRGQQAFVYEVDYTDTVKPTDVAVTFPTQSARLTLLTCLNYDHEREEYADRLVVVGHLR